MPRTFDGVDDTVTLSLGNLGFVFGPGTVAVIIKRSADGTIDIILHAGVGTSTARYVLQISDTNLLRFLSESTVIAAPAGIDTCLTADGWLFVAATKVTGTAVVRFHRYEYATNTWQHADSAATAANSTTPVTSSFIGSTPSATNPFAGDIAAAGVWNVVLTDVQIEALAAALPAWGVVAPKGLWVFDQSSTSQTVRDLTGGGANQSAITGTAVSASDVPGFSYVAPPPIVRKLQAVQRASLF